MRQEETRNQGRKQEAKNQKKQQTTHKKNQTTKEKKRRPKHRLLSKATPTERAPRRKT